MRKAVQLFCLASFCALFFLNAAGEAVPVPPDLFLTLDPLIGLTGWLASRTLFSGLLICLAAAGAGILLGRVFCAYVCPLGTLLDLAGRKKPPGAGAGLRSAKYMLLFFLLASAAFGLNLAGYFDPIAFLTRVFALFIYPPAVMAANLGLDLVRPLAERLGWLQLSHTAFRQPVFAPDGPTLLLLAALFSINLLSARFWCKNLCPLGGLLGLLGRCRVLGRRVDGRCTRCMRCRRTCPMDAIQMQPETATAEECILCGTCAAVCPESAISFRLQLPRTPPLSTSVDLSRRSFFCSAGAGVLAGTFSRLEADTLRKGLIRPPGAVTEARFQGLCVRCGQCLKACPTNTLQPCLLESGWPGIWTPRLWPRHAGCDQTCRLCGTVCPTGAIRSLSLEEKKHAKIGTARIDRDRCLVWKDDRLCLICDEQCPYNAIVFQWKNGKRLPFVVDSRCNGCGFCEEQCPVKGASAIAVTSRGELRLNRGSYIAKAERLQLNLKQDPGDGLFFLEAPAADAPKQPGGQKKPPGFE